MQIIKNHGKGKGKFYSSPQLQSFTTIDALDGKLMHSDHYYGHNKRDR